MLHPLFFAASAMFRKLLFVQSNGFIGSPIVCGLTISSITFSKFLFFSVAFFRPPPSFLILSLLPNSFVDNDANSLIPIFNVTLEMPESFDTLLRPPLPILSASAAKTILVCFSFKKGSIFLYFIWISLSVCIHFVFLQMYILFRYKY